MFMHMAAFLNEFMLLGWPHHYGANALKSLPHRHESELIRAMRKLGRLMRKHNFNDIVNMQELRQEANSNPLHKRIVRCMAPPVVQTRKDQYESFPFTRALLKFLRGYISK